MPSATCVLLNWQRQTNLPAIIDNLPSCVDEVIVWDNSGSAVSVQGDRSGTVRVIRSPWNFVTLGRYVAATYAKNELILTQDDDCLPEWDELLAEHEPGRITSFLGLRHFQHAPHGYHHKDTSGQSCWETLVGWGGAFERSMIQRLLDFSIRFPDAGPVLRHAADRLFSMLQDSVPKWLPAHVRHLPGAAGPEAMCRQPGYRAMNERAYELAYEFLGERRASVVS